MATITATWSPPLIPDTHGKNCIEMRDTGPGIKPEAIPKLFDHFYTSDKQGGTGLGLPDYPIANAP